MLLLFGIHDSPVAGGTGIVFADELVLEGAPLADDPSVPPSPEDGSAISTGLSALKNSFINSQCKMFLGSADNLLWLKNKKLGSLLQRLLFIFIKNERHSFFI